MLFDAFTDDDVGSYGADEDGRADGHVHGESVGLERVVDRVQDVVAAEVVAPLDNSMLVLFAAEGIFY